MPRSKQRKKSGRRQGPRARPPVTDAPSIPPIDGLVQTVLRGGRELLEVEDPLEAELWASSMLGTFYKLPLPLEAREELERSVGPAIVKGAEGAGDAEGLAVLTALSAVGEGELGTEAPKAADRLTRSGAPAPAWSGEIGRPAFVDAWVLADVYGDQEAYYATFRYRGREPHTVMALYDENLGGIIKDALVGYAPEEDLRSRAEGEPGTSAAEAEPGVMAARITQAIERGDRYLDNDWTPEFKRTRALLLSRMRLLPAAVLPEPPPPLDDEARTALTTEFLASSFAPTLQEAPSIVGHCLDARCDFGDGDPLRWSPTVVELYMLDYLPRRAVLDAGEIRALPEVLRGWVRFALTKRGLGERWIAETEEAVLSFTPEFRRSMTDHARFGPAKAIANAMLASGVDLTDRRAVDEWIAEFNARPAEERDQLLGMLPLPGDRVDRVLHPTRCLHCERASSPRMASGVRMVRLGPPTPSEQAKRRHALARFHSRLWACHTSWHTRAQERQPGRRFLTQAKLPKTEHAPPERFRFQAPSWPFLATPGASCCHMVQRGWQMTSRNLSLAGSSSWGGDSRCHPQRGNGTGADC